MISSEALATTISSSTERVAVVVGRGARAMGVGRVPQVFPGADRVSVCSDMYPGCAQREDIRGEAENLDKSVDLRATEVV